MEQEYKNILVPVDGSDSAEKALARAVESAKANHAHLDILNVIDTRQFSVSFSGMMDGGGSIVYQTFEDTEKYMNELKENIVKAGFSDVDIHVRFGSPKTVIAKDFIEDHHSDLIIMGQSGLKAVERMLMGAVTDYVTRLAPCDVLVVK
ncbi:universal stress protein [Dellaglioa sp. BT-FLS60]